jgi:hypothetical protein
LEIDMSHFSVVVCLPPMDADKVSDALDAVLAPYDENMVTEPYREYIEDAPKLWETALKWYSDNPDRKPAGLDELSIPAVLSDYRSTEVFEEHPADSPVALYYSLSTYNPKSKWDWWTVGGRWGRYFPVKNGDIGHPELMRGERRRSSPADSVENRDRVDGGRRRLLDFDALRAFAVSEAGDRYDRWTALVDGLPEAQSWAHFVGRVRDDTDPYSIEMAREDYQQQSRVRKARESKEFRWADNVIGRFAPDRDTYTRRAAEGAVPGYALIDLDGEWIAPGEMGWVGLSSDTEEDRAAYEARANTYLDGLPDDAWVVVVDCHI